MHLRWSLLVRRLNVAGLRGALAAIILALVVIAAPDPARAGLSGEMQGAIADMVNSAIATEDAKGLADAINDLCAAHPDIKEEIVAAVAGELAGKRPPGFCAFKVEPCLDLDSIMDTLLTNMLASFDTASGESRTFQRRRTIVRDNTGECGGGDCTPNAVEPPPSSSPSPTAW